MFLKNKQFKLLLLLFPLILFLAVPACKNSSLPHGISHYTCPMHPQINRDQAGSCPICGMDLVPVKKEIEGKKEKKAADQEGHRHGEEEMEKKKGIRINPIRQQNIGMQTAEVNFRNLTKSLLFQGKVAFDPKLWLSQREYIIALRLGDRSLIRSAEERLNFLGLSKEWIRTLKKNRKADTGLYLSDPEKPTFFEVFINQGDLDLVKEGETLRIYDIDHRYLGEGIIRAIGTMLNVESRTIRALIQSKENLDLKPNTFVQFEMNFDLGKRLSIPKKAVLFNGDHNMVYVETSPGIFAGRRVELGQAAKGYYEVKEGLKVGEKVVTNGHFLLDSETQMRMGTVGGHEH